MLGNGEREPFLTHVAIEDFRSIRSAQAPLGPLTVIVGRNGAGKSNIVTAIRRFSQLARLVTSWTPMESPDDRSREVPSSGTVKTSVFDPADLHRLSQDRTVNLKLSVGTVAGQHQSPADIKLTYLPEADRPRVDYSASNQDDPTNKGIARLFFLVADVSWLSLDRVGRWDLQGASVDREQQETTVWEEMIAKLDKMYITGPDEHINHHGYPRLFQIESELFGVVLEEPNLEYEMFTRFIDKNLGHNVNQFPFRLMSLGTRQAIPVFTCLVAMATRHSGILLVEEPEISLHPKAQVAVGEYFTRFASEGVQTIFTTHSHYLLLGISKAVREGVLPADDVVVLDCARAAGGTTVNRLPMDHLGRIEGWIPSFAEVDDDLFEHWVRSMPEEN